MPRGAVSVIVLLLIVCLTALFFFSPGFIFRKTNEHPEMAKDLIMDRLTSLGNSIAHAAFVEDAVIISDDAKLTEVVTRLKKDEPELSFVHITDAKYKVLASADSSMMGKTYNPGSLMAKPIAVQENNGLYEGAFAINVGQMRVGALFLGIKPQSNYAASSGDRNPRVLIIGAIFAIAAFLVTFIAKRRTKASLVAEMNRRQEDIFSPKVEALRQAQNEAQKVLNDMNERIKNAEIDMKRLNDEYEERKKEAESDPLVQSVEKLKAAEVHLIKNIEELKAEKNQLDTEITLLSQKREEVLGALENEKKEERTLHEKLDLIKKKILHLETPGK
jgi:hypothetical protein